MKMDTNEPRGIPPAKMKKYRIEWAKRLEEINLMSDEEKSKIRSMRKYKKNAMNKLKRKFGILGQKVKPHVSKRKKKTEEED